MNKREIETMRDKEAIIDQDYRMLQDIHFCFCINVLMQTASNNKKETIGFGRVYFLTKKQRLNIKQTFIQFIELLKSFDNSYHQESLEYAQANKWINYIITQLTAMYQYKDHDDESNFIAYKFIKNELPFVCFNFKYKG